MKRDNLYTFLNAIIIINETGYVNSDLGIPVLGIRNLQFRDLPQQTIRRPTAALAADGKGADPYPAGSSWATANRRMPCRRPPSVFLSGVLTIHHTG